MRTIRIYELDITYPEGSERFEDHWDEDETRWVWRWPQERRFLSRSGAFARAERLSSMGCTVVVRQSEPIAFEEAPAAHFDAQDPTPPEAECTSDPVALPWEDPNFKPF